MGGGHTHWLLALVILTIDHASLSRRSTVPTPIIVEKTPTFGRSLRFSHMLHVNFLLILSSCCFAFCGHHLSPINRIAIVFSLLSSVSNFSMSHSSIFLISNISRSPLYIHLLPLCEFYPILLCHKGTSVLFPPPPDYWHTSFFFLAGPDPLH